MKVYAVLLAACVVGMTMMSVAGNEEPGLLAESVDYETYLKMYPEAELTFTESLSAEEREAVFNKRVAKILRHNERYAAGEVTWYEGLSHMSAMTAVELKRMMGVDLSINAHTGKHAKPHTLTATSFDDLPTEVDWRNRLPSITTAVKNQGSCGSCYSFASAETLEAHYALATGQLQALSEQMILETPNPNGCGGTGGCQGGTAQLVYDYIVDGFKGGLASEWTYPYRSGFGQNFPPVSNSSTMKTPVAYIDGYVQLPKNDELALLDAVANKGPVAVSVAAISWADYKGGVYDGCNQSDPDVDHAVVMWGFGTDPKYGPYTLIRNSWTPAWGEDGYTRLARHTTPSCAWDTKAQDGFACRGTDKVYVCGTCAVYSDSCYPTPKAP